MSKVSEAPPETLTGKALRSFYFQGKVLEAGKACELPRIFALEMQAARKFEVSTNPPAQAEAPKPEPIKADRAKASKGEKDAG